METPKKPRTPRMTRSARTVTTPYDAAEFLKTE